jgi:septum formation inhibitor-activating ATPase MinD
MLRSVIDELGIELAGMIPADERVGELDAQGQALVSLNGDSPAAEAVSALTTRILTSFS